MLAFIMLTSFALGTLFGNPVHPVAAQSTSSASSFTYQGHLLTSGQPVSGSCAFQFSLYDAASAGTQLGTTQTIEAITVKDGYFNTTLDFGLTPFTGVIRYLEISVKCASEATFTSLGRQPLTAAPQALVAQSVPWAGLTGLPANLAFLNNPGKACTAGQVAKWDGTTWACGDITVGTDTLTSLKCTAGQVAKWDGTTWACGDITVGTDTLTSLKCTAGQVAKWDGMTWACGNITVGTDTLASLKCTAGQIAKRNSADTAWECATDTDTDTSETYSAGDGSLTLKGTAFSVNFAGSGTTTTAARSDHTHAALDGVPIGDKIPSRGKFTTLEGANLKVTGGSPAVGSVLTSDANGNATWKAKLSNIIYVAKSGGDFQTITAALDSIPHDPDPGAASVTNPYLIRVAPGVYEEQVTMKEHVSIEGAGEDITIIKWTGSANCPGTDSSSATVIGASNAELRHLTVQSLGNTTNIYATAIYNNGTSPTLSHLTISALENSSRNVGVYNISSSPTMNNLTITASGESNKNIGLHNNSSSSPVIYSSRITGSTNSVYNDESNPKIAYTMLDGPVVGTGNTCIGSYDADFKLITNCP